MNHGYRICRLVLALAALTCASHARAADQSPAEILSAHGLLRIDKVWVSPLEVELRQNLAELPKRRDKLVALEREIDVRIEANRAAWQQSRPVAAALQQALANLPTGDPQRAALQQQLATVEAAAIEPARLGTRGEVRGQVVQWNSQRSALATAVASIRRSVKRLAELYAELARDAELAAALRRAGDAQRLGPVRNYQVELQKLGDYERLVHTRWVPIHWQSGQIRLTCLVDDRTPVTFSYSDTSQQATLLTATAAESAGITIPADAPQEEVSLAGGRLATARRIQVPRLRLGACLLYDVSALVLPPEAEDWGSRISRDALAEHSVKLDPERLRLWIDEG